MLYTVYATPNIVLPFVGGLMVDKFGANQILLLLTVLVCVGQVVVAFGSFIYSFRLMLVSARTRLVLATRLTLLCCQIGRMLFGLGGESINIAQTTLIATWFRKRELGTRRSQRSSCTRILTSLDA